MALARDDNLSWIPQIKAILPSVHLLETGETPRQIFVSWKPK